MPKIKTVHQLSRIITLLAFLAVFQSGSLQAAGASPERALSDYAAVLPATLERAWSIDPAKGVATREVADNVYLVTDGVWQSVFVITDAGVVVFDAPETYAAKLQGEIAEVTDRPIRKLIYTHVHNDHIGGAAALADIEGLEILALEGVGRFLAEKNDPDRPVPTRTFADELILDEGGMRIELRGANYHSDEGDLIVYIPGARFLMAIDTLAPGYVPFLGFDITSNFHEYLKVFDELLAYDFDVFVGGHLTHPGSRKDVEETRDFTRDVYETVKRVHAETDLLAVFGEAAQQIGGFDNKFLLFKRFLDVVIELSTSEIEGRWKDRLAGVDVFTEDHVRTALIYVRWDD